MTTNRCPCCKQILRDPSYPPKPVRECYDCGNPIARSHKFTYQIRNGVTTLVHRVCSNPDSYYRAAENRKRSVVGYNRMSDAEIEAATAREDELEAQFAKWREENGR